MSAVTDFIAQLKGARVSPNIEPMRGDVDNFVLALQELSAPVENNQAANTFYAGPIAGAAAPPGFRLLNVNDPIGWGFTAGSIPFMTATGIAQNNANFFWDNTNLRLGIGTANPGDALHVLENAAGLSRGMIVQNVSTAPGSQTRLAIYDNVSDMMLLVGDSTGAVASVRAVNRNNQLGFWTGSSGGAERVRIDASGNVGIGTTTPAIIFDVNGPIGVKVYTVATLPSAAAKAGQFAFVSDATLTAITGLGLVPTGGGTNFVPVYSDGTNWRII